MWRGKRSVVPPLAFFFFCLAVRSASQFLTHAEKLLFQVREAKPNPDYVEGGEQPETIEVEVEKGPAARKVSGRTRVTGACVSLRLRRGQRRLTAAGCLP